MEAAPLKASDGDSVTASVRTLSILGLIAGWYAASNSITFTNKWVLTAGEFHYPFVMAFVQNVQVSVITFFVTRGLSLRPPPVSLRALCLFVIPIGFCTAVDIGLSNLSLTILPVSLHTILRGTVPAFVLLFALLLGLERPTLPLIGAVLAVVAGISLAVAKIPKSNEDGDGRRELAGGESATGTSQFVGALIALGSCAVSGLRWAITQLLMQAGVGVGTDVDDDDDGITDHDADNTPAMEAVTRPQSTPLDAIAYSAPACALCSGIFAALIERDALLASPLVEELCEVGLLDSKLGRTLLPMLTLVSLSIFALLFFEFSLVRATSSLSLSVFGVIKELLTIVIASFALGERPTLLNLVGFAVCAGGVLAYHVVVFMQDTEEGSEVIRAEEARLEHVRDAVGALVGDARSGVAGGQQPHTAEEAASTTAASVTCARVPSETRPDELPTSGLAVVIAPSELLLKRQTSRIRALGLSAEAGSPPASPKLRREASSRSSSRSSTPAASPTILRTRTLNAALPSGLRHGSSGRGGCGGSMLTRDGGSASDATLPPRYLRRGNTVPAGLLIGGSSGGATESRDVVGRDESASAVPAPPPSPVPKPSGPVTELW